MSAKDSGGEKRNRGPQRIVILCDGTWKKRRAVTESLVDVTPTSNDGGDDWFTNVALLSQCLRSSATSKRDDLPIMPQIVFYQDGIGTSPNLLSKLFEGATGLTLGLKVREAYSFLVDNYLPGDEIFLFGFSRGAYTARTLAAFINYAGVLSKAEVSRSLKPIWDTYRQRKPSDVQSVEKAEETFFKFLGRWPSGNAMRTARGNSEQISQELGPDDAIKTSSSQGAEAAKQSTHAALAGRYPRVNPPTIQVVGVWDTVGALGVPGFGILSPDLSRYFSFFDPVLAPNVRFAFHALALDEDRKDFLPTMWYLPSPGTEIESDALRREGQILKQTWFQGSHSDVGGGHPWHGLSDITLAWMVAQLVDTMHDGIPLLNVDVGMVQRLQDRRRAWAKQGEHPSRLCVEFQSTRNVGWWNMPQDLIQKAIWKALVKESITNESLHHSVRKGGRYDLDESPQFYFFRKEKPEALQKMWDAAENEDSMTKSEKFLMWSSEEGHEDETVDLRPSIPQQSGQQPIAGLGSTSKSEPALQDTDVRSDTELPPERPTNFPKPLWDALVALGWAPVKIIAFIVNLGPRPNRNLEPGLLLKLLGKFTT